MSTVAFAPTPSTVETAALDSAMRQALARSRATDTLHRAFTALLVALSHGSTPAGARSAITSLDPELAELVRSKRTWHRLVRDAQARVGSYPLLPAAAGEDSAAREKETRAARLKTARQLVGRLLAPIDRDRLGWTLRGEVRARIAFAVIGVRMLEVAAENGSLSIICTHGWLAAQTGWSPDTAGFALQDLRDAGWISLSGKVGLANRYRIARLRKWEDECAWLPRHADAVDALVTNTPNDLAEAILAVNAPAFAYGDLGMRGWLRLVAGCAITPFGEWLGLSDQAARSHQAALVTALMDRAPGEPVVDALDRWDPIAQDIRQERLDALAEASAASRQKLEEYKADHRAKRPMRDRAAELSREAYEAAGHVPLAEDGRETIQHWAGSMRGHWASKDLPEEMAGHIRASMTAALVKRGTDEAVAARIMGFVLPTPTEIAA